ncbi:hypothetical protein ACJJIK_03650 [Microbulbifer sp. ZKSA006]|uniref:hypothetical protein n=1 Tax=Microbulbifer sp. ZKSA006 TaxID=3243390 RepID=UPI004039A3B7
MKFFLLRLLWVTHGPMFRMAEHQGGMLFKALVPVALVYFSIVYLFLHFLLFFIVGIDFDSLGMDKHYFPLGVWFCIWFFEIYLFREGSQRRLKDGAKKNKKLNQLAEECMSRGYALMWWPLIIVLFIFVLVGMVAVG